MSNEMLPGDVLGIFNGTRLTSSDGLLTAELLNDGQFRVRDGFGNFLPFTTGPDERIKFLYMWPDGMLAMMDITGQKIVRKATDASGATVHASKLVLHNNGDLVLVAIPGSTALTWINGAFT